MPEVSKDSLRMEEVIAPTARFSAPLSFWSHARFMKADRFHPALRYTVVAVLLAMIVGAVAGVDAAKSAAGDARTANAPIASRLSAASRRLKADSLIDIATCPVLQAAPTGSPVADVPLAFTGNFTYFPLPTDQINRQYANWRISYFNTWKFVENLASGEQYVLTMRGTTAPTLTAGATLRLPTNDYDTTRSTTVIQSNVKYFTVPIQRLCLDETVSVGYAEILGLRSKVTGYGAGVTPTSPCAAASNWPTYSTYGNATIKNNFYNANCDLVLGTNGVQPTASVKSVSFTQSADKTMLGRAEWVTFLGAFFNLDATSQLIFDGMKNRYNNLLSQVASQFSAGSTRPTVAWISHTDDYGPGYPEAWTVAIADYKNALTTDAGGSFLKPTAGSGNFDPNNVNYATVADFRSALRAVPGGVQMVIDETYAFDPTAYGFSDFQSQVGFNASSAADLADFPFLANKAVYRYDGVVGSTGSLDWFEDANINSDGLLADWAEAITQLLPSSQRSATLLAVDRFWLRNIATGEAPTVLGNASTCTAQALQTPTRPILLADPNAEASDPSYVTSCPSYLLSPETVPQLTADRTYLYPVAGQRVINPNITIQLIFAVDYNSLNASTQANYASAIPIQVAQALSVPASQATLQSIAQGSTVAVVVVSDPPANAASLLQANKANFALLNQAQISVDGASISVSSSSSSTGSVGSTGSISSSSGAAGPSQGGAASTTADAGVAALVIAALLVANKIAQRM